LSGILEVAGIASIAPFVAVLSSPNLVNENETLIFLFNITNAENRKEFVIILGFGVIAALLVSNSYQAFMMWVVTNFSRFQTHRLSVRLLRQYLFKPYSFFLDRNTSEMGKNVVSEVSRGVGGVLLPLLNLVSKSIISVSIFILVALIDPYTAIMVILVFGSIYTALYLSVKKLLHKIGVQTTDSATARFKIAHESMSGIKEIKLRGSENIFIDLFDIQSDLYAKNYAIRALIASIPRYFIEVIAFGGIIVIIISMLIAGKDESEVIVLTSVYVMASYRLLPAIQGIYGDLTSLKFNLPILGILANDLKNSEYKEQLQGHSEKIELKEKISIKDVYFSYDGNKPILNKINLSIPCNGTIGFVGTTGSGKTTLIDILLGLLTPDKGSIFIDSTQINQKNLRSWQKKIGYVPQSIFLIDDSVEKNIAFSVASNKIDKKRVVGAAKMADLHDFILTLEGGYSTSVGERGVRLSGGQLQRIGIARALYHNPEVLILDEATSSLDGSTENTIMESIHGLAHKKTIIIIAHRLTTLKECDVIHLLDKGQVVASGNYHELVGNNKQFRKLANIN
jgi:ATP-binding cassette, subfamily B, bacterial PglK